MARPKTFIKTITIDVAKRAHNCKNSKSHRINSGDKRIGLKEGRSNHYYCVECAIKFINSNINSLIAIREEIEKKIQILPLETNAPVIDGNSNVN